MSKDDSPSDASIEAAFAIKGDAAHDSASADESSEEPTSQQRVERVRQTYRKSLWLYAASSITALAVCLATFDHATAFPWRSFALIQMIVLCAVVLPLWLSLLFRSEMAHLLFTIVVRMLGFLGGLAFAQRLEGDTKKTYAVGLLACYFVVLVLESWLHIRHQSRTGRQVP